MRPADEHFRHLPRPPSAPRPTYTSGPCCFFPPLLFIHSWPQTACLTANVCSGDRTTCGHVVHGLCSTETSCITTPPPHTHPLVARPKIPCEKEEEGEEDKGKLIYPVHLVHLRVEAKCSRDRPTDVQECNHSRPGEDEWPGGQAQKVRAARAAVCAFSMRSPPTPPTPPPIRIPFSPSSFSVP